MQNIQMNLYLSILLITRAYNTYLKSLSFALLRSWKVSWRLAAVAKIGWVYSVHHHLMNLVFFCMPYAAYGGKINKHTY